MNVSIALGKNAIRQHGLHLQPASSAPPTTRVEIGVTNETHVVKPVFVNDMTTSGATRSSSAPARRRRHFRHGVGQMRTLR